MLHYFIQLNYATVVVLIFMFTFILSNRYFEKRVRQIFGLASVFVLILVVVDSVEYWTASFTYPTKLRIWMSAIGYTLRPAIIMMISMLVTRDKKNRWFLMLLPGMLNAIVAFSALFTDIAFSYGADNEFIRGPLGFSAYIASAFYLILLCVVTLHRYREENTTEAYISIAIGIMSCISTFLEAVAGYDGLINVTGAISVMVYYLYLNSQQFKRDELTNVLNRRCFYFDAEKELTNVTALISIDLNNLKQLNDNMGHAEGDKAICTMVRCVRKVLLKNCRLYRTGGDEFMVLCFKKQHLQIEEMIKRLREEMDKTGYSCAVGIAFFEPGQSIEYLCSKADEAMYKDKAEGKSQKSVFQAQ